MGEGRSAIRCEGSLDIVRTGPEPDEEAMKAKTSSTSEARKSAKAQQKARPIAVHQNQGQKHRGQNNLAAGASSIPASSSNSPRRAPADVASDD